MAHRIWDDYLDSKDVTDWRNVISEQSVDDVINFLDLNPDFIVDDEDSTTLKECIWVELALLLYAGAAPSSTQLENSPSHINKHITSILKHLDHTIAHLEMIYDEFDSKRFLKSKDAIIAKSIIERPLQEDPESNIQNKLESTLDSLSEISKYLESTRDDKQENITKRGKNKPSKEIQDDLIFELCNRLNY